MFNKKLLAASMAAAISAGMVAQVSAVQLQENNIGQVLLSPIYYTSSDLNTEITVVNTRTDAAVKAKIVFRESVESDEVLDFIIYLTPGDVFRASITGDTNAAILKSTDDSMTDASGAFSSDITQALFKGSNDNGSNGFGHVEIIGAYSITTGTATTLDADGNPIVVKAGMSKVDLKKLFDAIEAGTKSSIGTNAVASSIDPVTLQIMAESKLVDTSGNALATHEFAALGATDYAVPCTTAGNCVISNTGYDATNGPETKIGVNFGALGTDTIMEIEEAIATRITSFEYDVTGSNVALPVISFVTKYRHKATGTTTSNAIGTCGAKIDADGDYTNYSQPFEYTPTGEVIFSFVSYDNSENYEEAPESQFSGGVPGEDASLPNEVNLVPLTYFADSGWAYFEWKANECSGYNGIPALSVIINVDGGSHMTETGERRQDM